MVHDPAMAGASTPLWQGPDRARGLLPGLLLVAWAGAWAAAPTAGQAPDPRPAAPQAPAANPCDPPPQGPVRVQIGTVDVGVEAGQRLTVPVRVKGVCDLARFAFGLSYGDNALRLVRVDPAPFLAGKPEVDVEFVGLVPGALRQTIQGARAPGTGGVDGVGTLARVTIFGLRPGVAQLALERLQLWDSNGALIPSTAVPVRVSVIEDLTHESGLPANRRAR